MLLRGVARSKQHVPKKAAPITPQILKEMFCLLDMRQEFDIVCWCAILLMFFLMARKSNLLPNSVNAFDSQKQLIRQDIEVLDDMLIVNIKWSKTRQYGHSRQMPVIAMPDHCLCPVTAYKAMVSTVVAKESDPAFCFYSRDKPNRLVPLTYAQFQAKLRELISFVQVETQIYFLLTRLGEGLVAGHLNQELNRNSYNITVIGYLNATRNISHMIFIKNFLFLKKCVAEL